VKRLELTLDLTSIAEKWSDTLAASTRLKAWCQEKYGKDPTIFYAANGRKLPDKKYCPVVIVLPGLKHEGISEDPLKYIISVSWCVENNKATVDGVSAAWNEKLTGSYIKFDGARETDEFGQLIYEIIQEVAKDIFPVSSVDFSIETQEFFPQWPGFMILSTDIEPTFGEIIKYE